MLAVLAVGCGPKRAPPPTCTTDAGVQVPDEGFMHVPFGTPVTYQNNPPASGDHWPCWTPYGVANTVVHPEAWVHNLEHGAIVLLYQCQDATSCPAAQDKLVAVDQASPDSPTGGHRVVVTPDPTLPTPFAAVSWDWVLSAQDVDQDTFVCFAAQHEGNGREDIPVDGTPGCQ